MAHMLESPSKNTVDHGVGLFNAQVRNPKVHHCDTTVINMQVGSPKMHVLDATVMKMQLSSPKPH